MGGGAETASIVRPGKVEARQVREDGASGLDFRQLFGPAPGRKLHVNLASVHPGGLTRAHKHEWEQVNYILAGQGVLVTPEGKQPVRAGTTVHVASGEQHHYENTGAELMEILGVLGPMPPAALDLPVESYLAGEVPEAEVPGGAMARRLPLPSWAAGPSVRLVRIEPGRGVAKHIHETELEFIVMLEGKGHMSVGDREIACEAGRVIVVPPRVPHEFKNDSAAACRLIGIVVPPVVMPA